MKHLERYDVARRLALLLALMLALFVAHGRAFAEERQAFSQPQLEQMLAPIALYPDPLLSQILMASTYPLEVVEAARWSRGHANLAGDDAVRAAGNENWDPSVKSLLAFPQVLARMDENLQWLQALGDAFLGQEPQVMDTVQNLRRKAQVAGNLRSDERQRILETGPLLVVQPADPQIIYVPYYDPRVVYGPWWWPAYSPVYWRPFPGYRVWPGLASGFYWGPSIRISLNYFFGGFDWPRRHVRVVQSNYYYNAATIQRANAISGDRPPGAWQHDPVHRRGVAYRGAEMQQRVADAGSRPDSGHGFGIDDGHRQEPRREHWPPASNRSSDAGRPAVQAAVQPNGSTRAQPPIRQDVQPFPASVRQGEPRNDVRRTAVQQARDTAAKPAILQVAVTQPHADANSHAERRDPFKNLDRGDRREPAESRQAARPANAVPQAPANRDNVTALRSDQAGRSARPGAGESAREPAPSPAAARNAQRGVERHNEPKGKAEAHPDSDLQRGASPENAGQQLRHQR